MAIITRRVSDISGKGASEEDQFSTLVVRTHPKVSEAKRLDALPEEVSELKEVGDLVILEVKDPTGAARDLYVRYSDFVRIIPDEVVMKAPGTKGRQPGYRPTGNGG